MSRIRPRSFLPALAAVVALLGAGCGDDGGQPVSAGEGPAGDVVVLLVENVGGFLPAEVSYQMVPTLAVYGDGRVIEPGAQILVYPGPALPALQQREVASEVLDAIEDAARDAGLDRHDVDYGEPPVADAGDTVVTVVIDGETYVHRATALGLGAGTGSGLTDEQIDARTALETYLALVQPIESLPGADQLSEAELFDADRYRLWVQPAVDVDTGSDVDTDDGSGPGAAGIAPGPDDPTPTTALWTVDAIELAESTCLGVEGAAATDLAAMLADANQLTRFDDGSQVWSVVARPVLPHEPTCPEA